MNRITDWIVTHYKDWHSDAFICLVCLFFLIAAIGEGSAVGAQVSFYLMFVYAVVEKSSREWRDLATRTLELLQKFLEHEQ